MTNLQAHSALYRNNLQTVLDFELDEHDRGNEEGTVVKAAMPNHNSESEGAGDARTF